MRRWFTDRSPLTGLAALGVAGWFCLSVPGCGGEPAGDDAYGQKFEAPADAPKATGEMPDSGSDRRAEIKNAQEIAEKKAAAKAAGKKR